MVSNFHDWIAFVSKATNPGFEIESIYPDRLDEYLMTNCKDIDDFFKTCSERLNHQEYVGAKRDKAVQKVFKKNKNQDALIDLMCDIYKNALIRTGKTPSIVKVFEKDLVQHGPISNYDEISESQIEFLVQKERHRLKYGIPGETRNGMQKILFLATGIDKDSEIKVALQAPKTVTFTISKEINQKFSKFCKEKNINKSKFIDKLLSYEIDNYMNNPKDNNFYKLRFRNMKLIQECSEKPVIAPPVNYPFDADEEGRPTKYAPSFIKLIDSISVAEFDENRIKKFNKSKKSVNAETYADYCNMIKRHENGTKEKSTTK